MGNILVADDDKTYRDSIQKVFEREGYTVQAAADVDSALEEIDRQSFDLIVCDYRMPGKTGIDFLIELQKRHSTAPVLMISAHADAATQATAIGLGATDLLRKPLRRRELVNLAARFIGG